MLARRESVLGALLLSLALFAASTFSTWMPMTAVAFLATLVVAQRTRRLHSRETSEQAAGLPRAMKWALMALVLVATTAVAAAWRLGDHLGDSINPVLVGVDILAHVAVIMSFLLWTVRPRRGHVAMLFLGLLVVLLCVAAGGTSQTLAGQTTVALGTCFGFVIASQLILGGEVESEIHIVDAGAIRGMKPQRLAILLSLLSLSLILMATSAIARVTSDILPLVRDNLNEQLKSTLDAVSDNSVIGGTRYVQGSSLGSIRRHILADPDAIALRIHAERVPGYLRGTAFDLYRRGRWYTANDRPRREQRGQALADRAVSRSGRGSVDLQSVEGRLLSRFAVDPHGDEPITTVEIENDPIKGGIVFLPLATRWLEANASELTITRHQIIRRGVDVRFPYVAVVGSGMRREEMNSQLRSVLLDVPVDIRRVSDPIGRQITNSESTVRGKAKAVAEYFRSGFTYSLSPPRSPDRIDPVAHFLISKHPAHCEYFASATMMLLRSVGVPTRYVTGYVSTEYSDEDPYWLARNRDAHAWVEAYDKDTGIWFPVETTPGRSYLTIDPSLTSEEAGDVGAESGDLDENQDETMIGRWFSWIVSQRVSEPLMVLFRIAQLPLFCVLVFLLWFRFLRSPDGGTDPDELHSRRMLRQVDRLCRKRQLIRQPHETLHRFASRIEGHEQAASDDPRVSLPSSGTKAAMTARKLAELAGWYRQFAEARYQGRLPVSWRDSVS